MGRAAHSFAANVFAARPMARRMRANRRAFTLVELTLGIVVTGIMGLALTGFMMAVANCWRHAESSRMSVISGGQAQARLEDRLIDAKRVGAVRTGNPDPAALLVWKRDANGDGLMQLSELLAITHNPDNKTLEAHVITVDVSQGEEDVEWSTSDFTSASAFDKFFADGSTVTTLLSRVESASLNVEAATSWTRFPTVKWDLSLSRRDNSIWNESVVVTMRAPSTAD